MSGLAVLGGRADRDSEAVVREHRQSIIRRHLYLSEALAAAIHPSEATGAGKRAARRRRALLAVDEHAVRGDGKFGDAFRDQLRLAAYRERARVEWQRQ